MRQSGIAVVGAVEGAWEMPYTYLDPFLHLRLQQEEELELYQSRDWKTFHFFLLGLCFLFHAQLGPRGQTPAATPSIYDPTGKPCLSNE